MKIYTLNLLEEVRPEDYLDAQGIIAEDVSEEDAAHEAAIEALGVLTARIPVPFIVKGRVKRLEDVKKYLYAGAEKIYLTEDQKEIYEEAAARFGKERLTDTLEFPEPPVPAFTWEELKKNSDGLVPVIVQDYRNQEVLMMAYMNEEAYEATLATGHMTYFSRSRQELWEKGATSGHYQFMKSLTLDCDNDTLLAKVAQIGAACHTGHRSCFFQTVVPPLREEKNPQEVLEEVSGVIHDRKLHPKEGSYTNYLFDKGIDKILKKVGEEAAEIIIAAKNPAAEETIYEMSDFLYHMMVLMEEKGISWREITDELSKR